MGEQAYLKLSNVYSVGVLPLIDFLAHNYVQNHKAELFNGILHKKQGVFIIPFYKDELNKRHVFDKGLNDRLKALSNGFEKLKDQDGTAFDDLEWGLV